MTHTVRPRRKDRFDVEARRVALKIVLAVLGILTFGLLLWLALGRPHRHGRHYHWK